MLATLSDSAFRKEVRQQDEVSLVLATKRVLRWDIDDSTFLRLEGLFQLFLEQPHGQCPFDPTAQLAYPGKVSHRTVYRTTNGAPEDWIASEAFGDFLQFALNRLHPSIPAERKLLNIIKDEMRRRGAP